MPNQYTKFKDASKHPSTRSFRWKQYKSDDPQLEEGPSKKGQHGRKKSKRDSTSTTQKLISDRSDTESNIVLSPQSQLLGNGHRIDPFKAYPISPDRVELDIIDYYISAVEPSKFPPRMITDSDTSGVVQVNPHLKLLLPYFMEHPVLFNAIMTTCQASILISRGKLAYEDYTFLRHRAHAVSKLRDKLSNEKTIDDAAILSVAMLLTAEYLVGNAKAVVAHITGLDEMIRVRGGFSDESVWGQFVKNGILAFQSVGGFFSGTLTAYRQDTQLNQIVNPFETPEYPSHPYSDGLCMKISGLPQGFSDLVLASHLSTQTIELISAVKDLHSGNRADDRLTTHEGVMSSLQIGLQRFSQNAKITQLEKCIYAGLLAHTFQFPLLRIPTLFHDPPLQNFIHILSQRGWRVTTAAERYVMIWIHMTVEGIMALRQTRLPRSRELFIGALRTYEEMRSWETLEKVLQLFFYTDDLLRHWKLQWFSAVKWNTPNSGNSPRSDAVHTITTRSGDGEVSPGQSYHETTTYEPSLASSHGEIGISLHDVMRSLSNSSISPSVTGTATVAVCPFHQH